MIDEVSELFSIGKVSDLALSYSRLSDFDRNGPKALNLLFFSNPAQKIDFKYSLAFRVSLSLLNTNISNT